MDIIEQIRDEAQKRFADARGSHDWEHTLRVYNLCLHIGNKEHADIQTLQIAALLHDIGRIIQDESNGKICHAEKGAEMAQELLAPFNLDINILTNVIHCIKTHRYRGTNIPTSIEAKILFDSDKLDSIGAVGIGRAFLFAGEIGAKLHNTDIDITSTEAYTKEDTAYREYVVKLQYIKDRMLTDEGKRLAQERHDVMVDFFNRLNQEVVGAL